MCVNENQRNRWSEKSPWGYILDHITKTDNETIMGQSFDCHGVSNYRSIECWFSSLFKLTTKKNQRYALLSVSFSHRWPVGPRTEDSIAENASIWWRQNAMPSFECSSELSVTPLSLFFQLDDHANKRGLETRVGLYLRVCFIDIING